MRGILIDPGTGDLLVTNGRLTVGDATAQTAEYVLQAMRGEFKEFPLLGAEVLKLKNGNENNAAFWCSDAKQMLQAAGVPVSRVKFEQNQITIE